MFSTGHKTETLTLLIKSGLRGGAFEARLNFEVV